MASSMLDLWRQEQGMIQSPGSDTFAGMFRQAATGPQFGLSYAELAPYMTMSGADLQANWGSLPANLKAKLGNSPEEFAKKVSYAPDGAGGWKNTFVEKGEGLGDFILPALIAGVGDLSGGFGLGELFSGATGGASGSAGGFGNPEAFNLVPQTGANLTGGAVGGVDSIGGAGDWWTELGLTPADVGMEATPFTTNPGMSDLTGGVLTDAGSTAAWTQELAKLAPGMASKATEALKAGAPASTLAKTLGISEGALSMLGKLGSTALGVLGSSQQSNSLEDLAKKYDEYGAPSRARYEAGMTPGFDPMSIPGYSGAVDTASKGILARLSASGGNPWGNPGGLIDANKQIISGTAMPAINEYLRLNANTGFGKSMDAALNLQTGGITADRGITTALASGLGSLTEDNDPSLAAFAKRLKDSGFDWTSGKAFA